jgi:predicted nuclease of predicted toxin-antitoxin system
LLNAGTPQSTVYDSGLHAADDRVLWDYAVSGWGGHHHEGEDFALRRTLVDAGPAIVWLRRGNTSRRELLAWFEVLLPTVIDLLSRDEPLIEIA